MLENCMVLLARMLIDQHKWWQFQQDMALAHTVPTFKAWMKENEINLMSWPALSPILTQSNQFGVG